VSRDLIEYKEDKNLYRYVFNNINKGDATGMGIYVDLKCILSGSTVGKVSTTCEYNCIADKSKDPTRPMRGGLVGGGLSSDEFIDFPDQFSTTYVKSVCRPWSCPLTLDIPDKIINDIPTPGTDCSRSDCLKNANVAYKAARTVCKKISNPPLRTACETTALSSLAANEWACSKCRNP
jgi:hypothetical protein